MKCIPNFGDGVSLAPLILMKKGLWKSIGIFFLKLLCGYPMQMMEMLQVLQSKQSTVEV